MLNAGTAHISYTILYIYLHADHHHTKKPMTRKKISPAKPRPGPTYPRCLQCPPGPMNQTVTA